MAWICPSVKSTEEEFEIDWQCRKKEIFYWNYLILWDTEIEKAMSQVQILLLWYMYYILNVRY